MLRPKAGLQLDVLNRGFGGHPSGSLAEISSLEDASRAANAARLLGGLSDARKCSETVHG